MIRHKVDYDINLWRKSIFALGVVIFGILFLFRDTFWGMALIWSRSETFTHGFFVLPIVLWLIWRRRHYLLNEIPKSNPLFIFPIIFGCVIWIFGDLASVNSITQLMAVALLVSAVPAVIGWPATSTIIFPLFFLFFAVPLGEFLLPQFMEWTADFTVLALRLSGVPVYREGLQFLIPSGNWSVVEACSGIRYLISSVTVGTLFAYINYESLFRRFIFICFSIVVSVLANWVRAYLIVMLGHFSGNQLAVGVDHLIYGWLFFGLVIVFMFMIGMRWSDVSPMNPPVLSAVYLKGESNNNLKLGVLTFFILFFMTAPHFLLWRLEGSISTSTPRMIAPVFDGGWSKSAVDTEAFKPLFKNATAEINSVYANGGDSVGFYVGYYRNQNYNRKLVSSDNVLIASNDPAWVKIKSDAYLASIEDGRSLSIYATELRAGNTLRKSSDRLMMVWRIYWVNGVFTNSDYLAKIYAAFQRILGRGDDSAVLVLYAEESTIESANSLLEKFVRDNFLSIRKFLEKTQGER